MINPIPRKRTLAVESAEDAITETVSAIADAAARGAGVNEAITFPNGFLRLKIGTISITQTVSDADILS